MNSAVEADTPEMHEEPSESVDSDNTDSHDDSGSGTSTSNNHTDRTDAKVDLLFLQHEEKQVRMARYILAIVTLLCAVTVTLAVFFSNSNDEYRHFEDEVRFVWNDRRLLEC